LLTDKVIDFVYQSRAFVPHFHVPLQSGNDEVLKKMKRRYLSDLYQDRVAQIKNLMPDACIGGDVIVGFPDETDGRFLDTYNFLIDLDISYLHVFSYSERPNTAAVDFPDKVSHEVRNKRSKILRGLSVKKRRAFYESQLGNTVKVLFENENKKGYITGFSENYVKVRAPWNPDLTNQIKQVSLQSIDQEGFVRIE
jgi:threonylcarbamoyladenosine tRNA methylthiotransferase MtaB